MENRWTNQRFFCKIEIRTDVCERERGVTMEDSRFTGNIIIYKTEDQQVKVDVRFYEDTVWLTLDQMAELFERDKSTVSRHIKNVFSEGELDRRSVVAKFATTAADGKTYQVDYYNLDVIISVGYRVKSLRGTQFRQWATKRLNEYIRKGFTLDDDRLKNLGGRGYWKELLERIRDIRASEKVFYPMPEPRILPSSIGGEMNWRFPAFSVADLVELR